MAYLTSAEWGKIQAQAWIEDNFKKELENDPRSAIDKTFPDLKGKNLYELPHKPEDLSATSLQDMENGNGIQPMGCCC